MTDSDLSSLRSNAERLQRDGTVAQRSAAAAIMPAIEGEIESRRVNKRQQAQAAAVARPRRRRASTKIAAD
jgi:hypothetical protein